MHVPRCARAMVLLFALVAIAGRLPCWCEYVSPPPTSAHSSCCGGHNPTPVPLPVRSCDPKKVAHCCAPADLFVAADRGPGAVPNGLTWAAAVAEPGTHRTLVPAGFALPDPPDPRRFTAGPLQLKLHRLLL